jgi:CIC family chloride channel protein
LNYRQIILWLVAVLRGNCRNFKAPLAGMLFTLEVLMLDLTMASLVPLMIASVTATTLTYFLMGDGVLLSFNLDHAFNVENIGFYIFWVFFAFGFALFHPDDPLYRKDIQALSKTSYQVPYRRRSAFVLILLFPSLWGEGLQLNQYHSLWRRQCTL